MIDERRHELKIELPPEPVWLQADLTRLAQVFVNLLNNSAKYTEPGGHIWLQRAPGRRAGGGIAWRTTGSASRTRCCRRIFDMFTQVDRGLERTQGGLGIGLTLVRRLVELHGGTIEARSQRGHGSTFSVRLPVAAHAAEPLAPAPGARASAAGGTRAHPGSGRQPRRSAQSCNTSGHGRP